MHPPNSAGELPPPAGTDTGRDADRLRVQAEQQGLSLLQLAGRHPCQEPLHPVVRLPGRVRPSRRQARMGAVLHRQVLGHALAGDVRNGLSFRGAGSLPFGTEIRSVQELFRWLVAGLRPQPC